MGGEIGSSLKKYFHTVPIIATLANPLDYFSFGSPVRRPMEERGKREQGREGGPNRMDKSSGAVTFLPCILLGTADADGGDTARLYLLHAGWGGSYAYLDLGWNSGRVDYTYYHQRVAAV